MALGRSPQILSSNRADRLLGGDLLRVVETENGTDITIKGKKVISLREIYPDISIDELLRLKSELVERVKKALAIWQTDRKRAYSKYLEVLVETGNMSKIKASEQLEKMEGYSASVENFIKAFESPQSIVQPYSAAIYGGPSQIYNIVESIKNEGVYDGMLAEIRGKKALAQLDALRSAASGSEEDKEAQKKQAGEAEFEKLKREGELLKAQAEAKQKKADEEFARVERGEPEQAPEAQKAENTIPEAKSRQDVKFSRRGRAEVSTQAEAIEQGNESVSPTERLFTFPVAQPQVKVPPGAQFWGFIGKTPVFMVTETAIVPTGAKLINLSEQTTKTFKLPETLRKFISENNLWQNPEVKDLINLLENGYQRKDLFRFNPDTALNNGGKLPPEFYNQAINAINQKTKLDNLLSKEKESKLETTELGQLETGEIKEQKKTEVEKPQPAVEVSPRVRTKMRLRLLDREQHIKHALYNSKNPVEFIQALKKTPRIKTFAGPSLSEEIKTRMSASFRRKKKQALQGFLNLINPLVQGVAKVIQIVETAGKAVINGAREVVFVRTGMEKLVANITTSKPVQAAKELIETSSVAARKVATVAGRVATFTYDVADATSRSLPEAFGGGIIAATVFGLNPAALAIGGATGLGIGITSKMAETARFGGHQTYLTPDGNLNIDKLGTLKADSLRLEEIKLANPETYATNREFMKLSARIETGASEIDALKRRGTIFGAFESIARPLAAGLRFSGVGSVLGLVIGTAFGNPLLGAQIGAAAGFAAGAGGNIIYDRIYGKAAAQAMLEGEDFLLSHLAKLPFNALADRIMSGIWMGQQIDLLKHYYKGNLGKYLEDNFTLKDSSLLNVMAVGGNYLNAGVFVYSSFALPTQLFITSSLTQNYLKWAAPQVIKSSYTVGAQGIKLTASATLGEGIAARLLPFAGPATLGGILGSVIGLVVGSLLGFGFGPMAMLGATIGGIIGTGVGVFISGLAGLGTGGWGFVGSGLIVMGSTSIFTLLGQGIGDFFDKRVNQTINGFLGAVTGVYALLNIANLIIGGFSIENVVPFAMALLTIITMVNSSNRSNAIHDCTNGEEQCTAVNGGHAEGPLRLENYNITLVSKDQVWDSNKLQYLLIALDELNLNLDSSSNKIYLSLGNTDQIYKQGNITIVLVDGKHFTNLKNLKDYLASTFTNEILSSSYSSESLLANP